MGLLLESGLGCDEVDADLRSLRGLPHPEVRNRVVDLGPRRGSSQPERERSSSSMAAPTVEKNRISRFTGLPPRLSIPRGGDGRTVGVLGLPDGGHRLAARAVFAAARIDRSGHTALPRTRDAAGLESW
jgi:hypothetical protein